jgi:hypothetical protein
MLDNTKDIENCYKLNNNVIKTRIIKYFTFGFVMCVAINSITNDTLEFEQLLAISILSVVILSLSELA